MSFNFDLSKKTLKRLLIIAVAFTMIFSQFSVVGYAGETDGQEDVQAEEAISASEDTTGGTSGSPGQGTGEAVSEQENEPSDEPAEEEGQSDPAAIGENEEPAAENSDDPEIASESEPGIQVNEGEEPANTDGNTEEGDGTEPSGELEQSDPAYNIETIEFVTAKPLEVVKESAGYMDQTEVFNESTGENETVDFYYYDPEVLIRKLCKPGNYVVINGDQIFNYRPADDEKEIPEDFVNDDNVGLYDIDSHYWFGNNQYTSPWKQGGSENFMILYVGDQECNIPVTIIDSPVDRIEFSLKNPLTIYENTDGGYREYEDGEFYYYDTALYDAVYKEGNELHVYYKDGTDTVYTSKDYAFYDPEGNKLEEHIGITDNQYQDHWTVGGDNNFTVEFMGKSCDVPVTIESNPVTSFSFELSPDFVMYENVDGEWDTRWGENEEEEPFFKYFESFQTAAGNKVTVNGTEFIYKEVQHDDYAGFGYYDSNGNELPYGDIRFDSDQYMTPWTVGGRNAVTVSYMGKTCDLSVPVTETKYKTLDFEPEKDLVFYENDNGRLVNEGEADEYFSYDLGYDKVFRNEDKIIVNKGTPEEEVFTLRCDGSGYLDVLDSNGNTINNGNSDTNTPRAVKLTSDQSDNHWETGKTYNITMAFLGLECQIPVKVEDNPVDSFEFIEGQPSRLYEGKDGWEDFGEDEEGNEHKYYRYNFSLYNLGVEGSKVIINGDHEYVYGCNSQGDDGFYDKDGNSLEQIGEIKYSDNQTWNNPWTVGTDNEYTLSLLGKTWKGTVEVLENPVKTIAFTPAEPFYVYTSDSWEEKDTDGNTYTYYDDNLNKQIYRPGSILTVNGTDYVYGKYKGEYEFEFGFLDKDGKPYEFGEELGYNSNQGETHWTPGSDNRVEIYLMGQSCYQEVSVIDTPVTDVDLDMAAEITLYENLDNKDSVTVSDLLQEGDTFTVKTSEGTKVFKYGSHIREDYGYNVLISELFCGDEYIDYSDIYVAPDQAIDDWTAPGDYELDYIYKGFRFPVTVHYRKNPVESISFECKSPIELYEESGGWWENGYNGKTYIYNDPDPCVVGNVFKIKYTDETEKEYTYTEEGFRDSAGNVYDRNLTFDADNQYQKEWKLGSDNYFKAFYMGKECQIPVTIIENPVESFEYIPYNEEGPVAYLNGTGALKDRYVQRFNIGDIIRVKYNDGKTEDFTCAYGKNGRLKYFVDGSGKIRRPSAIRFDMYVPEEQTLKEGTDNTVTIEAFGHKIKYPLTVRKDNVKSVSVDITHEICAKDYDYRDYTAEDGTVYYVSWWKGGEGVSLDDMQAYDIFDNGDTLSITDQDGVKTVYTFRNEEGKYGFYDSTGLQLPSDFLSFADNGVNSYYDNPWQEDRFWKSNASSEIYLSYLGHKSDNPIPVVLERTHKHVWNDGEVTTPAACETKGVKTYTCTECGETRTEEIAALGHEWGSWTLTEQPTCVKKGTEKRVCSHDSSHFETREVEATGIHTWDQGKVTTPAACETKGVKTFTCTVCGETKTEEIAALGHEWGSWTLTEKPTCVKKGTEKRVCSHDSGHVETREVPTNDAHTWNEGVVTTEATCEEAGVMTYTCTACGETKTEEIPALDHAYTEVVTKATLKANGKIENQCSNCGHIESTEVVYYPKTFKLSAATYAYNGKNRKPTVKVTDSNGKAIAASNYTLVYSVKSPKNVGKYTVTVKFKGNYSGSKALTYYIAPKGTAVKSLTAAKKALTVNWTKQGTKMSKSYVTGYQIQLATDKKFKKNVKNVTVKGYRAVSKKVTGLKAKTNYYVRIRTYMKVGTKTYYSSWSGAKVKKTK